MHAELLISGKAVEGKFESVEEYERLVRYVRTCGGRHSFTTLTTVLGPTKIRVSSIDAVGPLVR